MCARLPKAQPSETEVVIRAMTIRILSEHKRCEKGFSHEIPKQEEIRQPNHFLNIRMCVITIEYRK